MVRTGVGRLLSLDMVRTAVGQILSFDLSNQSGSLQGIISNKSVIDHLKFGR
jgi:hypothetical protein